EESRFSSLVKAHAVFGKFKRRVCGTATPQRRKLPRLTQERHAHFAPKLNNGQVNELAYALLYRGFAKLRRCKRHAACFAKTRSKQMNWDVVAGKWNQAKGEIRSKWGKLTDDDLELIAGKRDKLVGLLQERYGKRRDEAESELDTWL